MVDTNQTPEIVLSNDDSIDPDTNANLDFDSNYKFVKTKSHKSSRGGNGIHGAAQPLALDLSIFSPSTKIHLPDFKSIEPTSNFRSSSYFVPSQTNDQEQNVNSNTLEDIPFSDFVSNLNFLKGHSFANQTDFHNLQSYAIDTNPIDQKFKNQNAAPLGAESARSPMPSPDLRMMKNNSNSDKKQIPATVTPLELKQEDDDRIGELLSFLSSPSSSASSSTHSSLKSHSPSHPPPSPAYSPISVFNGGSSNGYDDFYYDYFVEDDAISITNNEDDTRRQYSEYSINDNTVQILEGSHVERNHFSVVGGEESQPAPRSTIEGNFGFHTESTAVQAPNHTSNDADSNCHIGYPFEVSEGDDVGCEELNPTLSGRKMIFSYSYFITLFLICIFMFSIFGIITLLPAADFRSIIIYMNFGTRPLRS